MEERREAVEIIRRYVKGEIEDEPLLVFARRLELDSVHQLPATLELGREDFRRIGFVEEDLARLLREHLAGRLKTESLRSRTLHLSQIFSAEECRAAGMCRPQLSETLSLLTLLLDPEVPLPRERVGSFLAMALEALEAGVPPPFSRILPSLLRDLDGFHFRSLAPIEPFTTLGLPRRPAIRRFWADLALLYRAPPSTPAPGDGEASGERAGDDLAGVWFIPLAVTTRRFWREELPARVGKEEGAAWMHPENCQAARLRDGHPWLPLDRFRPLYLIDPRGFAEVVLGVPELKRECLVFAIRLFALLNGGRTASLDGRRVELYPTGR